MQETEIKVNFNDGGMMKNLQDMLTMLDDIQDRAQGVEMPNQGGRGGGGGGGGAGDGGGGVAGFVGGVAGGVSSVAGASMGSSTRIIADMLAEQASKIPIVGDIIAPIMKAYGGIKGSSLDKRSEINSQIMGLEGLETQIMGLTGIGGKDLADSMGKGAKGKDFFTSLGFTPEEKRSLIVGMNQSFGRSMEQNDFKMFGSDFAMMQRTGINTQSVAGLAGAIQQNTGRDTKTAFESAIQAVNIAEQQGLVGSGVDRFVSTLSGITEDLTKKGIAVSDKSLLKFSEGIGGILGEKSGIRPLQIAQSLMGAGGQARQGFMGNFQQLSTLAIQAKAFQGAKSPLEAMEALEELEGSPDLARKAIQEAFGRGTEAETLALAPLVGTRDARKLTGRVQVSRPSLVAKGRIEKLSAEDIAESMPLTSAQASQTKQTVEAVRKDEKISVKMIELQGKMDRALLKFTENETRLVTLYEAVIKALEKIESITP